MKKVLIACIISSMALSMFTSCSSSESNGPSSTPSSGSTSTAEEKGNESGYVPNFDEDPYNVHFLYISQGRDVSGVQEAVNELALSEMNMTIELDALSWGTYFGTLQTLLAANSDLDLVMNFQQQTQIWIDSGYIQDWTPYLEYIPDVMAEIGDMVNECHIGGFLAGIPVHKDYASGIGLLVRGDIFEELGYSEDDFSVDMDDLSTFDQLTKLFDDVHKAYPDMTVYGGMNSLVSQSTANQEGIGNTLGILDPETLEFYNYYEGERFVGLCSYARDWFNAGYISSDAAINEDNADTLVTAGSLFCYSTVTKPNIVEEAESRNGMDMALITCDEPVLKTDGISNTVYCLSYASEDPVKAAACYNWMYQSREFNDLINWGVEGVDWIETEDGFADYPEGVNISNVAYHNDMGFGYPNQTAGHAWIGNKASIWDDLKEWNDTAPRSAAFGLSFDTSALTDQISLCKAVESQYMQQIGFGTTDPETSLAQFNADLYAAGLQDIIEAKQEQFDAWYASKS